MGGEIVITQKEMVQNVFLPLVENSEFSQNQSRYLIAAMVEYHRSLVDADVPVDISTQSLWLKYIISKKEFQYMHMLLQYQSFSDSVEIAEDLFGAVNNGYPNAFQLVVDIYHRLKKYKDVLRVLLTANRVQEAISYVERFQLRGTPAKEILEAAHRLSVKQRNVYIDYFSKSNVFPLSKRRFRRKR